MSQNKVTITARLSKVEILQQLMDPNSEISKLVNQNEGFQLNDGFEWSAKDISKIRQLFSAK